MKVQRVQTRTYDQSFIQYTVKSRNASASEVSLYIPGRKPKNTLRTIFKVTSPVKPSDVVIRDDGTIQKSNPDANAPPKPKLNNFGQAGKAALVEVDDLVDNQAIIA
jgi:hypothetical protein